MPLLTSFERIGFRRGLLQRGREDVIEVLSLRFPEVPTYMTDAVDAIEDPDLLKTLHRLSIAIPTLSEFQDLLSNLTAGDEIVAPQHSPITRGRPRRTAKELESSLTQRREPV